MCQITVLWLKAPTKLIFTFCKHWSVQVKCYAFVTPLNTDYYVIILVLLLVLLCSLVVLLLLLLLLSLLLLLLSCNEQWHQNNDTTHEAVKH